MLSCAHVAESVKKEKDGLQFRQRQKQLIRYCLNSALGNRSGSQNYNELLCSGLSSVEAGFVAPFLLNKCQKCIVEVGRVNSYMVEFGVQGIFFIYDLFKIMTIFKLMNILSSPRKSQPSWL